MHRAAQGQAQKRGPEDSPFSVASLTPIQMPNLDLMPWSTSASTLRATSGSTCCCAPLAMSPVSFPEKERLHFIERMVPLIERNYNLCELGPRGTGKSHIYKEVSPYAICLSGGQTTTGQPVRPHELHARRSRGLWWAIGLRDAFGRVPACALSDTNAVQIMKDYMASGSYARGRDQINADASMVFEGNINDTVQMSLRPRTCLIRSRRSLITIRLFFDRIHYYLPGWEIPKMRSRPLTGHYGLITDCLSEFCKEMRRKDFTHHIDRYFRFNSDFNKRDEIAVRKTSGLAKLLFPDEAMDKDDVRWLLDYAIEGRRRVKEQLKIMAGVEFIDVNWLYGCRQPAGRARGARARAERGHADSRRAAAVRPRVWRVGRRAARLPCASWRTRPSPASASLSTRAWPLTSRCAIRWKPRSTTL